MFIVLWLVYNNPEVKIIIPIAVKTSETKIIMMSFDDQLLVV